MDRRSFLYLSGVALAGCGMPATGGGRIVPLNRPTPTRSQLDWHDDELAMFLHFGVNTFSDREWGDGQESPTSFNPTAFNAGQWASVASRAGFKAMVLTAKHHDGFCLWPTKTTEHSVAKSPWRNGRGDVVREFTDTCRSRGLKAGLYLSPWDRNNPLYGDSPRYNDLYCDQLTELLTHYGPISEVWVDGANGEGPNGKKQIYDWPRVFALVRRLQPEAVIFSDAGPDVRWCGNERGSAGDPNWATVDPASVPYIGAGGQAVIDALQHGDPKGTVWRPAEVDVSIRPGWFYHPADDAKVRTADSLLDLYFTSVGRNAKLLLNVPPTTAGLLHETDISRLNAFRDRRDTVFEFNLAEDARRDAKPTGARSAMIEVDLGRSLSINAARMEENIARGQIVSRYSLHGAGADGEFRRLVTGTTIGHAKLDRFAPAAVRRVRLVIEETLADPEPVSLQLFG